MSLHQRRMAQKTVARPSDVSEKSQNNTIYQRINKNKDDALDASHKNPAAAGQKGETAEADD